MKRTTTLRPSGKVQKASDPDNPPWTESMLGKPVLRRGRGKQQAPTKVSTTIRLDADVLAWFRATGPGYQTRINEVLRASIERQAR